MSQKLVQQQVQRETQTQQLSTLQVALSSLMELPVQELAERIKNEMVDNPAIEDRAGEDDEPELRDDAAPDDDLTPEQTEISDSLSDYASADDIPAYLQERADTSEEPREVPLVAATSPYDDLTAQIGEHDLDERERQIIDYLIGSLDDDGFLRKDAATIADELAIYHAVDCTAPDVERLTLVLQTFEPRGIGARSLQECLRLQLEDPDLRSPYRDAALRVINSEYKAFTSRHWDDISRRLSFDDEQAHGVFSLITHLNPRPGAALGSGAGATATTVLPDFRVRIGRDGLPVVELESGELPDVRVSPAFRDTVRQFAGRHGKLSREQSDAYIYARQKVEAAQTFISLLQRRRQTLLAVMQAIVEIQQDFFLSDDDEAHLVPMTLREVAARAAVDISTVSRAANRKYVQTDFGLYPLKFFFSLSFTSETGDELSSRQVKSALRELLETEDRHHPLPDEALAARLSERGFPIARRTVAKYREQLGFLTARLRRENNHQ